MTILSLKKELLLFDLWMGLKKKKKRRMKEFKKANENKNIYIFLINNFYF